MNPILITDTEIWKNIKTFQGYQVSNFGNVRSLDRTRKGKNNTLAKIKGKYLKLTKNKRGYLECRILNKDKVIHRLVAEAFISNPNNKPQVNHINGIKTDNRVENLEWVTNSENQKHAYINGLKQPLIGELNPSTNLTNYKVSNIKKDYNLGKTIKDISKNNGIKISIIRNIIYEVSWKNILPKIIKRDERKIRSIDSINKSLISRYSKKTKSSNIIIESIDLFGNRVVYKSINNASKITNIPRKTIEYSLKNKKWNRGLFWSKNNTKKLEELL